MIQTDHDLLTTVNVKLDDLRTDFSNHLEHHKTYMYFAWTTCIGLIVTLCILLLTK